jgi:hypothetical protein
MHAPAVRGRHAALSAGLTTAGLAMTARSQLTTPALGFSYIQQVAAVPGASIPAGDARLRTAPALGHGRLGAHTAVNQHMQHSQHSSRRIAYQAHDDADRYTAVADRND